MDLMLLSLSIKVFEFEYTLCPPTHKTVGTIAINILLATDEWKLYDFPCQMDSFLFKGLAVESLMTELDQRPPSFGNIFLKPYLSRFYVTEPWFSSVWYVHTWESPRDPAF